MTLSIRPELASDIPAIHALTKAAFRNAPHSSHTEQFIVNALRQAGARIDEIALPQLHEVARINASGGFSAAESYAWHRTRLAQPEQAALYDPRVRQRIEDQISAAGDDVQALADIDVFVGWPGM